MPQSTELAGGEGFTYEGDAAAFYLSALLAEGYAPGIDDRIVVRVAVQQRDFGEPLDDVIVDFEDSEKNAARLSLQVKRPLTISNARTNTDFREIIRDSWATLQKPDFRRNVDRYGVAVGTISPAKERALKTLCDWARESLTAEHFDARFSNEGNASEEIKAVRSDIVTLLKDTRNGTNCTSDEVHQFLAHFVLIQFDFLREGATDPPEAINRIRDCLVPNDASKAPLVWSRFVQLARSSAGKAGQFDRMRLVRVTTPIARLCGATSFRRDLNKLTELAKGYAALIPDDVGGTKLDRTSILETIDIKLASARVVQVRGLPGSGKSVVVKRAVNRALESGPVIFLKADQIEGTSWISYATSQGLSDASLEHLLLEVGSSGTPILFIDAIDRIEKEHQPVIIDLIRALAQSPLLIDWRIVVSLRDTGIEILRNWLGEFLDVLKIETLKVDGLNDEDAEILAEAKPHLRPLLFGVSQVRSIVRRPFFAKILNQSYGADSVAPTFAPRSEIDLIENWWKRGGYNESGQSAVERQRVLLDLAHVRARQLSLPIGLSQLTSVAHIEDLRSDGILQDARTGISVRFAHDIFFEWAFFHVLADCGRQWINEIKSCGEPPAIARAVELASQWEYDRGEDWQVHLSLTERADIRSQWLRAWLLGPLGAARFEADETQFEQAVFADNFRLFRKTLVWFQAEKTTPNPAVLAGAFSQEERRLYADLLGLPSDFASWRRLIEFILRRVSKIPASLYPEVVAIFDVWQNAAAYYNNTTSHALLLQCATWLDTIDAATEGKGADDDLDIKKNVRDVRAFRTSLVQLLLRSSSSELSLARGYLHRVTNSERIRDEDFGVIAPFSITLAQSLPQPLVDLSLAYFCKELPHDQVEREDRENREDKKWRKSILSKPKAERTQEEQMAISRWSFPISHRDFNYHDWDRLSIHDNHSSFWPPSPLREPFHSLFRSSPEEALQLLRELCNHAITAWRQLHQFLPKGEGKPIPLELTFPWGRQTFWGNDREYLWFRSTWAPKAIGSGFMALEEWCFAELAHNRPVDELIEQIIQGNECIAILGTAGMLALHTERVSETTLPIFSSQRLLEADHPRMIQDFSQTARLIGFEHPRDKLHIEAVQAANARPVRKMELRQMVPRFIFAAGEIGKLSREAILSFKDNLPFQYEEHRNIREAQDRLMAQALKYAELADPETYQAYRTQGDSDQIAIVHVSPSASNPENVARAEEATKRLMEGNLWAWADKSFEQKSLNDTYSIKDAIALAKAADTKDLFGEAKTENHDLEIGMQRAAVAATAAIVLKFRAGVSVHDLEWAREVLERATRMPEKRGLMWSPGSVVSWHPAIYVARGLAADILEGTALPGAARDMLVVIAHPLECVSTSALQEATKLWSKDARLTWNSLILALTLCHLPKRSPDQLQRIGEAHHLPSESQEAIDAAFVLYENADGWSHLPLPPPAWVKVKSKTYRRRQQRYEDYNIDDAANPTEEWGEPDVYWHSEQAAKVLECIPFENILESTAKCALLDFISSVLDWTIQKNAPPWVKSGRRDRSAIRIMEWTGVLGGKIGTIAGLLPFSEFQPRFLDPILGLEGENCWALLSPFVSAYVCSYLYDAPVIPSDAFATLELCLKRLLLDAAFKRDGYRSGEFSDFNQPALVRTLMFVSIEKANLAARFVNGDWSEIGRILPLIDRFVRAGGWAGSVMEPFLTLVERAKLHYPSEAFSDQILAVLANEPSRLKDWHRTLIPARIAELVQHFAHRDAPMALSLAQNFLRILDMLVDMGDRRSAALQLGEAFREIPLRSDG